LRGEESERDELFVKNFCKKNDIKLEILKINIKNKSRESKISLEECGREVRYNFFNFLKDKFSFDEIFTAHTLSDNIETFLFNFSRGTGLSGLSGIPLKRDDIVRPFLFFTRSDIENFCKLYKIDYINDSSNFSENYTRNKIRLNIIPEFKKVNLNFEKNVFRVINKVKEENDFLKEISLKEYNKFENKEKFSREILLNMPKVIKNRVLLIISKELFNINLEEIHVNLINKILEKNSGCVKLPENNELIMENNFLKIREIKEKNKILNKEISFFDNKGLTESSRNVTINMFDCKNFFKKNKKDVRYYMALDLEKISTDAVFRNRRSGDLFFPAGRNGTKSLKKFFNEKKVDKEKREILLVLASKNNILWIENFGASEHVKLDKSTKKSCFIEILN